MYSLEYTYNVSPHHHSLRYNGSPCHRDWGRAPYILGYNNSPSQYLQPRISSVITANLYIVHAPTSYASVTPTRRCHTWPSKTLQPALHADSRTDTVLYLNVLCFLERLDLKQMQAMTATTQAPTTEANRTARATINPRTVVSLVLGCGGVCEGASVVVFDSALRQVYIRTYACTIYVIMLNLYCIHCNGV